MLFKHAIITAAVVWGLIIVIALGVALFRHDLSVKSMIEYVWGTALAFTLAGICFRSGAVKGDRIERTEGVVRTSTNREGYIAADNEDAIAGFAFGTVVLFAALVVFVGSL